MKNTHTFDLNQVTDDQAMPLAIALADKCQELGIPLFVQMVSMVDAEGAQVKGLVRPNREVVPKQFILSVEGASISDPMDALAVVKTLTGPAEYRIIDDAEGFEAVAIKEDNQPTEQPAKEPAAV